MASMNFSAEQIRLAGRWKSDCYRTYTQVEMEWLKTSSRRMGEDSTINSNILEGDWEEALTHLGDDQEDEEEEEVV